MLIGRLLNNGRPFVAYETLGEIIKAESCLACMHYSISTPCTFYKECRADKLVNGRSNMFGYIGREITTSRMKLETGEIDYERCKRLRV